MFEILFVIVVAILAYRQGAKNARSTSNERITELEAKVKSLKSTAHKAVAAQKKQPTPTSWVADTNTSGAKFIPYYGKD